MISNYAIDFGATVLAADIGGELPIISEPSTSSGFDLSSLGGSSAGSNNGVSATDAIASFAILMVPTVMVLSREPEILEILGDLYNSATDPEAAEEEIEEEEEEIVESSVLGDESIWYRDFGYNFMSNFTW